MDIQKVVGEFLKSVSKDPDQLKQFGIDPEKAIKDATGFDLTDKELKDAVAIIEPMIEGKSLNMDSVVKTCEDFLQGDNGDLMKKLGGIFGGENKEGEPDAIEMIEGIAGNLFGKK